MIIGQNYIGSVVTQCEEDGGGKDNGNNDDDENDDDEDDDDAMDETNTVFGITTAINLTQKADIGCVQELRDHLLARAEQHTDGETLKTVRRILTADKNAGADSAPAVGFLLNERFVNIPPQISVPLLENLIEEVDRAAAKGMPYTFDYYVMLVKLYRTPTASKAKAGKKNKAKSAAVALSEDEFYTNAEEEIIFEQALCSFEYSVKGEATADDDDAADGSSAQSMAKAAALAAEDDSDLVPFRKLVIFEAKKLPALIESIKKLIGS